jgi:hypothetical protein
MRACHAWVSSTHAAISACPVSRASCAAGRPQMRDGGVVLVPVDQARGGQHYPAVRRHRFEQAHPEAVILPEVTGLGATRHR